MSTLTLKSQAVSLAHSTKPGAVEDYNSVLDKLERRLSQEEFFQFALSIFGE